MMNTSKRPTTDANLSSVGVRLRLQSLSRAMQVLAIASLAESHSGSREFTTKDVARFYGEFRLPPVPNLSDSLGRLRNEKLLVRPSTKSWALTPLGEARLAQDVPEVTAEQLSASLQEQSGATFGHHLHSIIPPLLGPADSASGLHAILQDSAFEQNVMLITRFPRGPEDHYTDLIDDIRKAVEAHGLTLQIASDGNAEDTLWANVVTYMWASKYAIVLIDNADGKFNSNVLIEVGGMMMTGRRCAILRDKSVRIMPSDLIGHIYKSSDLADHQATVELVHGWIKNDLKISTCGECPP